MNNTDELLQTAVSSYRPSENFKRQIINRIIPKKGKVELVFVSSDFEKIFDRVFSKAYGFVKDTD